MNKGILTVGIILLAVVSLFLVNIINNYQTGGELDYNLVKETTRSAMQDATDYNYYRSNGLVRMDKDKFVESFLRRMADTVDATRDYSVKFYDLNEVPPKASVKVDSTTVLRFNGEAANITTAYDAIIETNYKSDAYIEKELLDPNSSIGEGTVPVEKRK